MMLGIVLFIDIHYSVSDAKCGISPHKYFFKKKNLTEI